MTGEGGDAFPWDLLLLRALELGLSAADFWAMSPRAVVRLLDAKRGRTPSQGAQHQAGATGATGAAGAQRTRLSRIPR